MKKGYRFQVLGYSLLFFLLFTVTCTLLPIYAADSTPSSSIRAKLEELKKEIASKAAKLKEEIDKKLRDKAFVGILKNKSETSLTLAASSGPKVININQDSVFESRVKSRKKFSKDTLQNEDYIASLGDVDETGVLTAREVILLPPPKKPQKTFLWGQIISSTDNLFTLKDKDAKSISVSAPNLSKFKINDFVILSGVLNENAVFEAEFLYIYPQGVVLKSKKEASSSASPSPKPSKSPTPKPSPR